MIKLNTDAATLGNPGPAGAGILIVANGQQDQSHLHLPNMSNHEAEFAAAIATGASLVPLIVTLMDCVSVAPKVSVIVISYAIVSASFRPR